MGRKTVHLTAWVRKWVLFRPGTPVATFVNRLVSRRFAYLRSPTLPRYSPGPGVRRIRDGRPMVKRSMPEPLPVAFNTSVPVAPGDDRNSDLGRGSEGAQGNASADDRNSSPRGKTATVRELTLSLALKEIAHEARSIIAESGAAVVLIHAGVPTYTATSGTTAPQVSTYLMHSRAAYWKTGRLQLCQNTESDSRFDAGPLRRLGVRSFTMMPIQDRAGEVTAILGSFSTQPQAFPHRDLLQLKALGSRVADHIELVDEMFSSNKEALRVSRLENPDTAAASRSMRRSWLDNFPLTVRGWNLVLGMSTILVALLLGWVVGRGERERHDGNMVLYPQGKTSQSQTIEATAGATDDGALTTQRESENFSGTEVYPSSEPDHPSQAGLLGQNHAALKHASAKPAHARNTSEGIIIFEKGKQIFPAESSPTGDDLATKAEAVMPAPHDESMVTVSEEIADEHLLDRIEPDYSESARQQRLQGAVVLDVCVSKRGTVRSLSRLSGDPLLSVLAAQAVKQWKFTPLLRDGAPVSFESKITLNFALP